MDEKVLTEQEQQKRGRALYLYMLFWSLAFLAAAPIGAVVSGEGGRVWQNLILIVTAPANLVTDYFNIGGLGSTLINAAVCGLACNIIALGSRTRATATTLAGYFLIVAHCFYGLNFINMWPPFIGVYLFCRVRKQPFSENLHIAMFATALAPFISDFLFRYAVKGGYVMGEFKTSVGGVILALLFGILSGFVVPALLPGTTKMHRSFNLYKAGLAIGILGMFVYAFLYKTLGIEAPEVVVRDNPTYAAHNGSYWYFLFPMFGLIFLITFLVGFFMDGRSFRGYRALWRSTGHHANFVRDHGVPVTFINIGLYGLCILAYLAIVLQLPHSDGFSGPAAGAIIAAITFSASGQTPRNVFPMVVGYTLFYGVVAGLCAAFGIPHGWSLASQGYISGLAFATGLCPFAGKYGWPIGVLAGFIHAIICTSTLSLHGGFVLYNGGLTAGLCALVLIPVLDFYHVKEKYT